jgi:hypothetical protein
MGIFSRSERGAAASGDDAQARRNTVVEENDLQALHKTWWQRSWPAFACGTGLYSDGYLNGYALPRKGSHDCADGWGLPSP